MGFASTPPFDLGEDFLDLSINEPHLSSFNDLTIVGFIVEDKQINFRAIKEILLSVWESEAKLQVSNLSRNQFACVFASRKVRERVLAPNPWSIKGHIVILKQWTPDLGLEELEFR